MPIDFCALAPAPDAEHQRHDAQDEGERRHQDRPEAAAGGLDRRFLDRMPAVPAQGARELDDQDRVLGRERDQQDQADLGVEVVGHAQRQQRRGRAQQRQRHRHDDGQRARSSSRTGPPAPDTPAAGSAHRRDRSDCRSPSPGRTWPSIRSRPSGGSVSLAICSSRSQALTGAEAAGGVGDDGCRRIEIVERDQRGTADVGDIGQRAERHHAAAGVAHHQRLERLRLQAGRGLRLHVDLEHAAELVELADVARADDRS